MSKTVESAAPSLKDIKVGQLVQMSYRNRFWEKDRPTDVHFTPVTHIDKKGHVYICDLDLTHNYRYGFNPLTGLSPYGNYEGNTLIYATPEMIKADEDRVAAEQAEKEADIARQHAAYILKEAAPLLADALVALRGLYPRDTILVSDLSVIPCLVKADEALKAAGLL